MIKVKKRLILAIFMKWPGLIVAFLDYWVEIWCNGGAARGCGEMVYTPVLGTGAARLESSSLSTRTYVIF